MNHRRIDVHHHILPPSYVAWLRSVGIHEAGGRDLPAWSPEAALHVMDEHFIETAVVSVSTPGVCPTPDTRKEEARTRSREVNEIAADLVRNHPGRFGFFATLTLPDVDGALAEAAYALDDLHASGIILLANTHGRYLGDPNDAPLFEELNQRKSVLFVHPSEIVGPTAPDVAPFAADFLLDTSRAAYRLVRNGFIRKYPHLKIILSHAGGFVPYASYRMAGAIAMETSRPLEDVLDDFRSFYFDTALSSTPAALPSLLAFAKPGHVLFGSDWPFAPSTGVGLFAGMLDAYAGLDEAGHAAINRMSAERLFPQFAV
jgi:predicted TIM-barrel fold metal-dependent hydrolase